RLSPEAENRADVHLRIGEMRERITLASASGSTSGTASARRVPLVARERDEESHPGRALKIAGVATGATGLALVGAGVYFGVRADSDSATVAQLSKSKGQWGPDAQAAYQNGQTAATRSTVLFVAGGAALAGGGVL